MPDVEPGNAPGLAAALLTALGASACCLGPFVLATLGLGGAWMSAVTALAPYRPVFIGLTAALLGLAGWRLYRVPAVCGTQGACAVSPARRRARRVFWGVALVAVMLVAFPYYGTLFLP